VKNVVAHGKMAPLRGMTPLAEHGIEAAMTCAVVFDVNETLLDLAALDPLFAEWFGDAGVRREWFAQTLQVAMTLAATRAYRGFDEVGAAALAAVARRRGIDLDRETRARLRDAMLHLPPHRDVAPALRLLREAGVSTAALTNNPLPVVREQLRHADLASLFDAVMSVEEAGALKPAPEVYRLAVARLGLPPGSLWMVAAHGWDIAGAQRCGLRGVFIARPGQEPDPFAPPEVVAGDLVAAARALLAEHGVG
jgi:2-haloacid dehalogenase